MIGQRSCLSFRCRILRQALCIYGSGRDLHCLSLSLGSLPVKDDSPSESSYPGVRYLPDVAASLIV